MRKAAAVLVGLLLGILPVSASAHPNGLHTWSLYKKAHLKTDAPVTDPAVASSVARTQRLQALDATSALAERQYDREVSRLWQTWSDFDARYWASLEPEPISEPVETEAAPSTSVVPTGSNIQALICSVGWDCATALRVASCESGFDPTASNGSHYGLFQRENETSSDPATQVANAYAMYLDRGWQPWGLGEDWGCAF